MDYIANDFRSTNLDDYTLMNSYDEAKWPAQNSRSTPRICEVETQENCIRLANQLRSVRARFVVGLGRPVNDVHLDRRGKDSGPLRAIRILATDHPDISFCVAGHPSPRAINSYGDGNARQWFEQTLRRLP
jgi:uracil-DNA glycosylase